MKLDPTVSMLSGVLLAGGVCGLIAKRLKLPMLIGYLIAGGLIGPHSPVGLPLIRDQESVQSLSNLGILLLLFSLGLEFGVKRITALGLVPWILGLGEALSLWCIGRWLALHMGFSQVEAQFIGAMLSFSSTTVILKTFDELKIRKARFTDHVLGILLVEDILTIFFIIVLSAKFGKVQNQSTPLLLLVLAGSILVWWLIGSMMAPRYVSRAREKGGNELLLVSSLGLCFGLASLAAWMDFSAALGAFMMGSILADTREKHTIETLTEPLKNLFVTVFFVSLGMLVRLEDLVTYWKPIAILTSMLIFSKFMILTLLSLFVGKNIQDAVRTGISFTQIGEFAFVIANLGLSLKVLPDYVLPIITGTCTITIIVSPIFMRFSDTLSQYVDRSLPPVFRRALQAYDSFLLSLSFKKIISKTPRRSKYWSWFVHVFEKLKQNYKVATQLTTSSLLDRLAPWDEYLVEVQVREDSVIVGQRLRDTLIRDKYNLNIVAIERQLRVFLAPSPDLVILPADVLLIYGQESDILKFEEEMIQKLRINLTDLRTDSLKDCVLFSIEITPFHPFINCSLRELKIRDHYQAIVLAILRDGRRIHNPLSSFVVLEGDQLFFVGHQTSIWKLESIRLRNLQVSEPNQEGMSSTSS